MTFISFAEPLRQMLTAIIQNNYLHAKWLNTLSFLENCGAKQIAACEHPTLVREEMLKHAAEEFRHAFYLKKQIVKISPQSIENYAMDNLLGGMNTLHYLPLLNAKVSRFLISTGLKHYDLKKVAYLLVTYAIELRAAELYPIYDELLKKNKSKVHVKSILLEEKEHLREMQEQLNALPFGLSHAEYAIAVESELCSNWIKSIH